MRTILGHRSALPWSGALLLLTTLGCRGYYPSWHYAPARSVHEVHLPDAAGGNSPQVRVSAHLVGILRPQDGAPRRLHARMLIDNQAAWPMTLDTDQVSAIAGASWTLEPERTAGPLEVASGRHRTVELFFPLPDRKTMPDAALREVELRWTLRWNGNVHSSRALFQRASYGDYYYGP